ncbi:AGE family epimerase/isomerase [soil metagenome]
MTSLGFQTLRTWLFEQSYPFWSTCGADLENGGFVERFSPIGEPIDDPRRARLVARQIYAFAAAERLGWAGPAREMVRHGLDYLMGRMIQGDEIVPLISPGAADAPTGFDLYDQAFVLFGLAAAAGLGERREELTRTAVGIRERMIAGWKHPEAGFEEACPRSLPLKANPHMHTLEASLAWAEVADADGRWAALADEIVELCLSRFLDPATGSLREYFDGDWNLLSGEAHDVVEPGHQFEWAWLLIRWGLSRGRADAIKAALRLIAIAESEGVSDQDLAVNELGPDLSVRVGRHRLWPQTERIKACVALAWLAEDATEAKATRARLEKAANGLLRFLDHPTSGAWWEHLEASGVPAPEPIRASSLYHITCAVLEMAGLEGPDSSAPHRTEKHTPA